MNVHTSPTSDLAWMFSPLVNIFLHPYIMVADVTVSGLNILSTYKGSPEATATLSGTSMASPRLLEALTAPIPGKTLTPLQLKKAIAVLASQGMLSDLPEDTVNLLIFNNATA